MTKEIERLLELGQMDLEAGYPEYAREYFKKVLELDPSNREARQALAKIEALLSSTTATTVGLLHDEPVELSFKVERKGSIPEVTNSHDERSAGPDLRKHKDTSDAAGRPDAIAVSVDRRIQYWEDRLHDMSRRNRLLFFKLTKASTAEIVHPSPTVLFDRLVVKGRTLIFPLPDEVASLGEDHREEASSPARRVYKENEIGARQTDRQMLRILRNLRTRARTAREEKGVNVLYLAFGFLVWREGMEGELSKAPLVLVPVDLSREALGKPVQLSMLEEDIVVNPSLQIKLRQDFGLELPEVASDLDAVGLEEYWKQVDSLVNRHSGWKVLQEVVLGIFGFQNLMIIADLKRNREALVGHPLIQALCSSDIPCPIPDVNLLEAGDLDDRVAPDRVFQVLDADSSQQEAIEAAKAGLSFVLQGPPGTGKSQTIANIIAEFLAKGRRVLFVSQKIAALEVVQRRLEQVGLGEFCLQIHSYRRDKREVVSELGHSLQIPTPSPPPQPQLQQTLQELRTTRDKLNDYVRALHKPRFKLGISAYHAYGQMARLAEVPQLRFVLPDLENVTPETHQERLRIIAELAVYPQVINQYGSHPWMGCRIKNLTLDLRSRLEETLLSLARDIASFQERVGELAQVYAVSPPSTLQEGIELLRVAQIYGPEIMVAPVRAILGRYEKKYQSPLRYFRRSYWRDSALLRDLGDTGVRPDPRSILTVLEYATRLQDRRIGDEKKEVKTPQTSTDLHQLAELAHQIGIAKEFISEQFEDDDRPQVLADFYNVQWTTIVNWCQQQAKHIDKLSDWVNFNRARRQGEAAGLSSFIRRALDAELEAEIWPEAFARGFYTLFLDAAIESEPILRSFRSSTHDVLINQFRELDKARISLACHQIRARLMEQRPQASWMKAASAEETILRRELNKKRRLKPLRRLFSEIPDLILSLRPCLMVSPLTVSQLLDPELYCFDLVVFDEASQIPPEYAVASILRGKQVVIAGDRHQLPPTRFFEVLGSDVYDEEEDLDEFESILNECDAAGMPSKMLLWHYRSRDESLIAFSNYHFYLRRLLTFPAADRQDSGTGLDFTYVPDGIYRRGKGARYNLIEARQVVQLILQHFQADPELSLGVVAFSQAQRDTIEHELERALRDWPSLQPLIADTGDEPFFIKNLETVQGDERDVIFFSIGYGFDETGRFLMSFGPLNRAGGERRLNVAVTRARLRVKVIASIQPEDIDLSRTRSRGAQLLRSYMALARDGVQALYADMSVDPEAEFESPFEASVYEALTDRGLHLHKQVGVSRYRIDLTVVDSEQPGRYLLGIECDGAMYHSAATARERDRLRQEVLEGLGWCMHRIWSRDWIENRNREIEKVLAAVETSRKRKHGLTVRRAKGAPTAVDAGPDNVPPPVVTRSVRKLPPEVRPYKKAILRRRGLGAASFHNTSRRRLVEVMQEVVNSEGPIEISVAKRRVAEAWAIKRIGHKIDSELNMVILAGEGKGVLKRRSGFLWPIGMNKAAVRVPQGDSGVRSVEQIAPEELSEGAYICVKAALSLDEDDLIKQTAWLFGLHATSTAVKWIRMAIRPLIETGRLERRGGKIRLPHS